MPMASKPKAIDMVLAKLPPPSGLKSGGGKAAPMEEAADDYADGGEDSAFNDFAAAMKSGDMEGAKAALADFVRMCASKVMEEASGGMEE